mmetsp:Transcript_4600/g.11365  ORF Transcript_4600/g.11365 Transcript_4600/m.11365 type:complete len:209 (-) Transcript_4600:92-718(-)
MFNSNFFRLESANLRRNVLELQLGTTSCRLAMVTLRLLNSKICFGGKTLLLIVRVHIDHTKNRVWYVISEHLVDVQIRTADLRSCTVPADYSFTSIHLLEHVKHLFMKVVVQKPNLGVLLVLIERNCVAIRDINNTFFNTSQKNTENATPTTHTVVVINHTQKYQRMNDDPTRHLGVWSLTSQQRHCGVCFARADLVGSHVFETTVLF